MKIGIIWNRLRKKNIIAGEIKVEKSEQEKVLRYSFLLSFPWNLFNTPHHWKVEGGNLKAKAKVFSLSRPSFLVGVKEACGTESREKQTRGHAAGKGVFRKILEEP